MPSLQDGIELKGSDTKSDCRVLIRRTTLRAAGSLLLSRSLLSALHDASSPSFTLLLLVLHTRATTGLSPLPLLLIGHNTAAAACETHLQALLVCCSENTMSLLGLSRCDHFQFSQFIQPHVEHGQCIDHQYNTLA